MNSMRKSSIAVLSSLIIAVLITGVFWYVWTRPNESTPSSVRFVALRAIPKISAEVLAAQGKVLKIEDPVPYFPALDVYLFDVIVHGKVFEFVGDEIGRAHV